MKIYIAGKISGLNREDVIKKFEATQKSLSKKGHQVFIPCVLPAYEEVSHEDYLHTKDWKNTARASVFFLGVDFIFIFVLFIAKFLK